MCPGLASPVGHEHVGARADLRRVLLALKAAHPVAVKHHVIVLRRREGRKGLHSLSTVALPPQPLFLTATVPHSVHTTSPLRYSDTNFVSSALPQRVHRRRGGSTKNTSDASDAARPPSASSFY